MLVNRVLLSQRLSLSVRATYRFFPATASSLVDTAAVLETLNASRRNGQSRVDGEFLPQLLDADRLAAHFGVSARRVRSWADKSNIPCPHFRLTSDDGQNSKYLFAPAEVEKWAQLKRRKGVGAA